MQVTNTVSFRFNKHNRYEVEQAVRSAFLPAGKAVNLFNRCADTLENVCSANGGALAFAKSLRKRIQGVVVDVNNNSGVNMLPFFYTGTNALDVEEAQRVLTTGDHVRVWLYDKKRGYGFYHHGIYDGNGMVYEYNGRYPSQDLYIIEKVSLESFARGKRVELDNRERALYTPDEIVRRAESRLGERAYNLFTNNCETFATWCRCGSPLPVNNENVLPVLQGETTDASQKYLQHGH